MCKRIATLDECEFALMREEMRLILPENLPAIESVEIIVHVDGTWTLEIDCGKQYYTTRVVPERTTQENIILIVNSYNRLDGTHEWHM